MQKPHDISVLEDIVARWDVAEEDGNEDAMAKISAELDRYCSDRGIPNQCGRELLTEALAAED